MIWRLKLVFVGAAKHALPDLAALERLLQRQADLLAGEALVVGLGAQRPVQTGRRHLQPRVRHGVDLQRVLQLPRDLLAVVDGDEFAGATGVEPTGYTVDVDTQGAGRHALDVDQLVTQACQGVNAPAAAPARCGWTVRCTLARRVPGAFPWYLPELLPWPWPGLFP